MSKLDVLGWGRGGLQGEGSSVVGVGAELVIGDDPMGLPGRGDAWEVPMPGVKGLDSRGWGFGFGVGGAQPSTLVGSRRDVVMWPGFLAGSRRGWWAWLVPEGYFMCLNACPFAWGQRSRRPPHGCSLQPPPGRYCGSSPASPGSSSSSREPLVLLSARRPRPP